MYYINNDTLMIELPRRHVRLKSMRVIKKQPRQLSASRRCHRRGRADGRWQDMKAATLHPRPRRLLALLALSSAGFDSRSPLRQPLTEGLHLHTPAKFLRTHS